MGRCGREGPVSENPGWSLVRNLLCCTRNWNRAASIKARSEPDCSENMIENCKKPPSATRRIPNSALQLRDATTGPVISRHPLSCLKKVPDRKMIWEAIERTTRERNRELNGLAPVGYGWELRASRVRFSGSPNTRRISVNPKCDLLLN